ncbi:MAG TPA: tetratricopeptide repeat protein, partial [Chthonomonadaceae bacterium]|nr:tetratricopeptide repeat protein [Chthonomonadaceae bacterium]
EIARFQTQKTAELLAYLAYYSQRNHPREDLMEVLWPEVEPTAGRNRLKQALASMRRQLEPPGIAAGSVLVADRNYIRLNEAAIETDVHQFKSALKQCVRMEDGAEKTTALARVVALYRGELLPGTHSDWAVQERGVFHEVFLDCLRRLIGYYETQRDLDHAIQYSEQLVALDGLNEVAYQMLIRLYLAAGQPSSALQQYRMLEEMLAEEMGVVPSEATTALISRLTATPLPSPPIGRPSVRETGQRPTPARSAPPKTASKRLRAPSFPVFESPQRAGVSPGAPPGLAPRLPVALTRFIGRTKELAHLVASLTPRHAASAEGEDPPRSDEPIRLMTLTGPGGCGKTRLALAVAERLEPSYPEAIWFVGLEDVAHPKQFLETLVESLHLPLFAPVSPLQQVIEALSRRPTLLLLDHFDHMQEAADIVQTLLAQTPCLTCLITSCHRLQIEGEETFTVPLLPTPTGDLTPEQLMLYDSVRLFVSRAQAVQSDFQLTADNASVVAALCRKLEGLPLAIDLAAAWTQILGTSQILERMSDRFELLVSRKKGVSKRHQSLRAVMDSNYELLPLPAQQLLTRLSVFHGGWSLEAAEVVCHEPEIVDLLRQLRSYSMVMAEEVNAEMRFHMLDTFREYASAQMSGAERKRWAHRHACYFLGFAEAATLHLQGPEQATWLEKIERDHANLLAALEWLHTQDDSVEAELRLVSALWRFWWMRGLLSEGGRRLTAALQRSEEAHGDARARALLGAAYMARFQGDYKQARVLTEESMRLYQQSDALAGLCDAMTFLAVNPLVLHENPTQSKTLLQTSIEQSRALGHKSGQAHAFARLGAMTWFEGDLDRAQELLGQSLDLYRDIGDTRGIAGVLGEIGYFAAWRGEHVYAQRLFEEKLALSRKLHDPIEIANGLWQLGNLARYHGAYEEATRLYNESLAIRRNSHDKRGIADSLSSLGVVAYDQGDYEQARVQQEESLTLRRQLGEKSNIAGSIERLAWIALAQGDHARARVLFEDSLATFRANRFKSGIASSQYGLGIMNYRTGQYTLAQKFLEDSLALRKALQEKKGILECLEGLVKIYQAQRRHREATLFLAAASTLRTTLNMIPTSAERQEQENTIRVAKTALSSETFQATWTQGAMMTLEETLTSVLE